MKRICPVRQGVCPFETVLEDAEAAVPTLDMKTAVGGIAAMVRMAANLGECTGQFVQELRHGTQVHCGNTEQPRMAEIYKFSREHTDLEPYIPETAISVTND